MYEAEPSEADLAVAGLTLADLAADPVEVWPENWGAYSVLCAMDTQWRIGMAGPTGLDYAALPVAIRMVGASRADWTQLMADVRVMEGAALRSMRNSG